MNTRRPINALRRALACAVAMCWMMASPPAAAEPGAPQASQSAASSGGIVRASGRMLNELMQRDVQRAEPVSENILGVTTQGTADTDCHIGLQLIPNISRGHLRLTMTGRATINEGVGSIRKVRVYTSSQTWITAQKNLGLAAEGIGIAPTIADCQTSIYTKDISAPLRFIENIAWKKANRMRPQAEQIAAERAGRRAAEQLDAEADEPLRKLHQHYLEGVYFPLQQKDAFPIVRVQSTGEHLFINTARAEAPAGPPPPLDGRHDLVVGFHQQFVAAMADRMLGGTTQTDKHLLDMMHALTGQMPRALWVHDRTPRWKVRLAERRPIEMTIAEDKIDITVRLQHTGRAEEQLDRPVDITARLVLTATPDGPKLSRSTPVGAKIMDGKAVNAAEDRLLDFLRRKFSGVFPEEMYFDGLVPPAGGTWAKLRRLQLAEFTAREGWLVIGYRWQATPGNSLAVVNP
ncbi:MAG: hypothetical protein WD468_04240 [Pirellulales bacterium]